MTKTLGGVALPPQLEWTDKLEPYSVAQSVTRTLGGTPVVFAQSLMAGRPVTLEARQGTCWLELAVATAILQLAALPDGVYPLVWGLEAFNVVFRHHEPPAVSFSPVFPLMDEYPKGGKSAVYGTIKLMTI
ncbi:hypothetical protein HZB60_04185 [candidate division KSB1 bacterium]|nr:hypothetical protein [candidate division KSB1 bacterium]